VLVEWLLTALVLAAHSLDVLRPRHQLHINRWLATTATTHTFKLALQPEQLAVVLGPLCLQLPP
jgi:hypothetical protein